MKVLIFTHKNDIDGMGNAVLANLAHEEVDFVLCGTFNLTENILKYYENGSIYDYDKVYVTDLCIEEPLLSRIANDEILREKFLDIDHHKTYAKECYTKHNFIKVQLENEQGLTCGTSLFYEHLIKEGLIDENNLAIKEFVELTRQHDTYEWKNIYNNQKSRELSILFDAIGCNSYIDLMIKKLKNNKTFEFDDIETLLINSRKIQINDKLQEYSKKVIYREILGLKAGIVFITYEYRNELADYFKDNNFDMDFAMMIALDPGVVAYRSVKKGVHVRPVAEFFGGKGHEKAATNPITEEMQNNLVKVLTKKNN